MVTKVQLEAAITAAEEALSKAHKELSEFNHLPENNIYLTLEDAEYKIERFLEKMAHDDCEGSHNCGNEQYTQLFMVNGKTYIGIANVEYNRHDKTYYYVDGFDFKIEEVK